MQPADSDKALGKMFEMLMGNLVTLMPESDMKDQVQLLASAFTGVGLNEGFQAISNIDDASYPSVDSLKIWESTEDKNKAINEILDEVSKLDLPNKFNIPQTIKYEKVMNHYDNELEKFKPATWDEKIITSDKDIINDYALYSRQEPVRYLDFLLYLRILDNPDITNFDDFYSIFDETACPLWSGMDRYGALKIKDINTRQENARYLWELPYHKLLILKLVKSVCGDPFTENVRYVNFLCYWIIEKRSRLNLV
jgi:hypothetical protein